MGYFDATPSGTSLTSPSPLGIVSDGSGGGYLPVSSSANWTVGDNGIGVIAAETFRLIPSLYILGVDSNGKYPGETGYIGTSGSVNYGLGKYNGTGSTTLTDGDVSSMTESFGGVYVDSSFIAAILAYPGGHTPYAVVKIDLGYQGNDSVTGELKNFTMELNIYLYPDGTTGTNGWQSMP